MASGGSEVRLSFWNGSRIGRHRLWLQLLIAEVMSAVDDAIVSFLVLCQQHRNGIRSQCVVRVEEDEKLAMRKLDKLPLDAPTASRLLVAAKQDIGFRMRRHKALDHLNRMV